MLRSRSVSSTSRSVTSVIVCRALQMTVQRLGRTSKVRSTRSAGPFRLAARGFPQEWSEALYRRRSAIADITDKAKRGVS
jgi:hypothetical protein